MTLEAAGRDISHDSPALAMREITRRYGNVRALDGSSLLVRRGTIHAVLGENGAGKTTLVRCTFGLVRPQDGTITLDGTQVENLTPARAIALGVGMVHQHFTLVPAMTVTENVALGGSGRFQRRAARDHVSALLAQTGLTIDPDARVDALPVGAQQRVEILKAVSRGARLLILDEPTAVLAPAETAELYVWLRRYVDNGNTAVLVTHKLRDALAIADDVTVLRHGRTTLAAPTQSVDERSLVAAMIGVSAAAQPATVASIVMPDEPHPTPPVIRRAAASTAVFRAEGVTISREQGRAAIADATFEIRSGELVGVAGVEGSGQAELLRALAGRLEISAGRLDRPARVGFVPEDRHRDALVLDLNLAENVALADAGSARGRAVWRTERVRTARLIHDFDVRATGPAATMRTLSGGNQQKLVLARELGLAREALVAENPTRGLDVRAIAAVHQRLRDARDAGTAVVLHSSDLDELLALADRVLVVHAGRVQSLALDRDAIGRALLGA